MECDFVVICDKNVFCIRFSINDTMQKVHVQKRNFNSDGNLTATMYIAMRQFIVLTIAMHMTHYYLPWHEQWFFSQDCK